MILTGLEIKDKVKDGCICIHPFDEGCIGHNSYRYKLDRNLLEICDLPVNPKKVTSYNKIAFDDRGYVLSPNRTYLANTLEIIGSDCYVPSLLGSFELGKLGLFLQITADLGNLGAKHQWTLELKAVQPIRIYPNMIVGEVSFWKIIGEGLMKYQGKYDKFSEAKSSEIYREFERGV